jgi:hypothetical protein
MVGTEMAFPQFSGWRARRDEKSWRLWQAVQEPRRQIQPADAGVRPVPS